MTDVPTGPRPSPGKEVGAEGKGNYTLIPHPDFPSSAITSITVEAKTEDSNLSLVYHVAGNIDAVLWPPPTRGGRADRLWEHSCFEAFVARESEPGYTEVNVATSGQWAAYDFGDYRAGMRAIDETEVALALSFAPGTLRLEASAYLPILSQGREWHLALTAIIEAKDGSKSYWALAHAPGPPDFHNRDCFTARLAAPSRA